MRERTNIWGKKGCLLPNGKLCDSCCVLPQIVLEDQYVSVIKPQNSPCTYLAKKGKGCLIYLRGKPTACDWHCESADTNHKLDLIAQALSSKLVSSAEALDAGAKFSNYALIPERAAHLSKITQKRDTIIGDPDEP